MRPFLKNLVSVILILTFTNLSLGESSLAEARLIRKAFLDTKSVPPSVAELDWYLIYNPKPYQTAVDKIVNSNEELKKRLLSADYKYANPIKLDSLTLDTIIKYQCGNLNLSVEQAHKTLIKVAIACGENNTTDTIDYLALCLMARTTRVNEINSLLKLFNAQPNEESGYLAVLNELKTYNDFNYK